MALVEAVTATRWLRRNLFRRPVDSVVTVLVALAAGYVLWRAVQFVFVTGRWEIIEVNLKLLMVGRYPDVHLPRVGISLVVASTVAGLLAGVVHRRQVDAGTATRTNARDLVDRFWPVAIGIATVARAQLVGRAVARRGRFDRRALPAGSWVRCCPVPSTCPSSSARCSHRSC